jgi:putative hydrolase of the HAD superfamily
MAVKLLIFDWGDTIMRDYDQQGPMFLWEKVDWVSGAEEALKKLYEEHYCVIATSAPHSGTEEMILALKRVGAQKYFRRFFSSMDLGLSKPNPGFFLEICKQSGFDVTEAVSIGNLCWKDIAGAKTVGLKTILFDQELKQECSEADYIIKDFNELIGALKILESNSNKWAE